MKGARDQLTHTNGPLSVSVVHQGVWVCVKEEDKQLAGERFLGDDLLEINVAIL